MVTGLIFVISQTYIQFRFRFKNIASLKNHKAKDIEGKFSHKLSNQIRWIIYRYTY